MSEEQRKEIATPAPPVPLAPTVTVNGLACSGRSWRTDIAGEHTVATDPMVGFQWVETRGVEAGTSGQSLGDQPFVPGETLRKTRSSQIIVLAVERDGDPTRRSVQHIY